MKYLLFFLLIIIPFTGKAQIQISGQISDEFGFSISDVLVYIDGSSISTYSDVDGKFLLEISDGNYNLVFRKENYQKQFLSVHSSEENLKIQMKETAISLDEALIVGMSEEDWKYYFEIFKQNFLGRNQAAQQCEILNPKVVKFRYDEENKKITASSKAPIEIENNYLGYKLEYDLVEFYIDYQTNYTYMAGTVLFSEMQGSKSKQKRWNKNREESYYGSIMHFMRALYNQKLKENGFIINRLIREENPDYAKFQENLKKMRDSGQRITIESPPPKIIQKLIKAEVPYDSLLVKSQNQVFINFDGLYDVEFINEKEDLDYAKSNGQQLVGNQVSVIQLIGDKFVEIAPNGNFYPPADFLTEGYFTWEKNANLLPLDYEPE